MSAIAAMALFTCLVPTHAASGPDRLRTAALSGDREAAFQLGRAYKLGDGVRADHDEAERWLEKAVRLGHPKAGAELGLVLFQSGKGGQAIPLLKKAAERGDARAQYALGTLYFGGKLVPPDPAQAKAWMRSAAKARLPAAVEALAIMEQPIADEPAQKRTYDIVTVEARPDRLARFAASPAVASASQGGNASGWRVQIGAFSVATNARRYWRDLKSEFGPAVRPTFETSGALTRLRLAPFRSRKEAAGFCAVQRERGRACFEVPAG